MSPDEARIAGIPLVSQRSAEQLSDRELTDYREYKRDLLTWLSRVGKHPKQGEGYADSTVRQVSYKLDVFYRWLWAERERYTTHATLEDADAYMKTVAYSDATASHKETVQKCLKRLFKFRRYERGETIEWDPEHSFTPDQTQPRDFLTIEERRAIREVALEYGSVPSYNSLSPAERDRWKSHLAQRFDKPKSSIGPADFERANGWKIPSLVWTSLDAGLRPIEVSRAKVYWVDVENRLLRIPKEESSKNVDNWSVALTDRTGAALEKWLAERDQYGRYDETDALWVTREGNPYGKQSLRRLLHRLCDVADIDIDGRQMSWYTIRHSVGTYLTREEDLAAAKAQLRHRSAQTTMKYDQVPVEDRQDALDRMG